MNITKIVAYFTFAAYIVAATYTPVWVAIWTVAFLIAIPVLTNIVNDIFPIEPVYVSPAPNMSDYYEAFSVEPDEVEEQVEDVWGVVEATSCNFACTITSQYDYNYQLCLPQADITLEELTEQVQVISYESYSYRELQQLVKQLRGNDKSIKLNSKKAVLIEWLQANA